MTIASTLLGNASSYYHEEPFLIFLDDHVNALIKSGSIVTMPIVGTHSIKYRNDVIGLLNAMNVPYPCHAATLFINRIKNNSLGLPAPESLLVPETSIVKRMYNTWVATKKERK